MTGSPRVSDPFKERLCDGLVADHEFDRIYPPEIRVPSWIHWTPVRVAREAAELLVGDSSETKVLDVGSGCGKFCLVGALTTEARFYGVEQRASLVATARSAARKLGVDRAEFIEGKMEDVDWTEFDAFYLFNPFHEQRTPEIQLDRKLTYSSENHSRYVGIVQDKLRALPIGTRVVTFHGFGGEFPPGYERLSSETMVSGLLELWVKRGG